MNLSKLLSLSLFAAFVANQHQVLGACAKKKITIQQAGSNPLSTTVAVSEAKPVAQHYDLTDGNYTGSVFIRAAESTTFLYQDSGTCVYSLVNVLLGKQDNSGGDVILTMVPGRLGNVKVKDGGTYTSFSQKLACKWSFNNAETEGFAYHLLPFSNGCITVESSFPTSNRGRWMWVADNSRALLSKNDNLEICFQDDDGSDGGDNGGGAQPGSSAEICEQGCSGRFVFFCWIGYFFQCILAPGIGA